MLTAPKVVEGIGEVPAPVDSRPWSEGGDQELPLVQMWCPPCRVVVGAIISYEVGDRLPGHAPYIWMQTQHPRSVVDGKTRPPRFRMVRTLLHDGDDAIVRLVVSARYSETPELLHTACSVHGELPFNRRSALNQAWKARQRILAAELTGEVPKPGRWKLYPQQGC
jgi:hypothetical protein